LVISNGIIITVLALSFVLPIFKSGGKKGMNFWQWIINHTIWAPVGPEYVPEEDYKDTFIL